MSLPMVHFPRNVSNNPNRDGEVGRLLESSDEEDLASRKTVL